MRFEKKRKKTACNNQTTHSRTNNQAAGTAAGRGRTHVFSGPGGGNDGGEIKRPRRERTNKRRRSATARVRPERTGEPVAAAPLAARPPNQPTLSCGRAGDDVTAGRHPAALAPAWLSHCHDILIRANTCDHQRAAQELCSQKQTKTKTKFLFWFLFFRSKFKSVD